MYAATIDAVNEDAGTTRGDDTFVQTATSYPRPTGVRDTRAYETQWADDAQGAGELPDGADQAMQAQAVTIAEGTLADEMRQAESTLRGLYGGGVVRLEMTWDGRGLTTRYVAAVCVGQYPDYVSLAGTGGTLGAAVDDLRAQVAGGVAA